MRAVVFGSRIRMMTAANRLGLYSALRACRAIVLRSSRQSRLTVATIFLFKEHGLNNDVFYWRCNAEGTHCNVGTRPLTPTVGPASPGVAAGVVGATAAPLATLPSFSGGAVRFPAPPGNDSEVGAVKALA